MIYKRKHFKIEGEFEKKNILKEKSLSALTGKLKQEMHSPKLKLVSFVIKPI
jgi:hypothetical protein